MSAEQQYVRVRDLAARFGVHEATVRGWLKAGELPPAKRVRGRLMWRRDDIDRWERESGQATEVAHAS